MLHADELFRRLAILGVVALGKLQVGQEHLVDGQVVPDDRSRAGDIALFGFANRYQPFCDDPLVLLFALGTTMLAEVDAFAVDLNERLAASLMEAVFWNACGHVRLLLVGKG